MADRFQLAPQHGDVAPWISISRCVLFVLLCIGLFVAYRNRGPISEAMYSRVPGTVPHAAEHGCEATGTMYPLHSDQSPCSDDDDVTDDREQLAATVAADTNAPPASAYVHAMTDTEVGTRVDDIVAAVRMATAPTVDC